MKNELKTPLFCPSCFHASMEEFAGVSDVLKQKGQTTTVTNLSGFRCPACGERVFDKDSSARRILAGDDLLASVKKSNGDFLRETRKKLKLTQEEAAQLTGGGHNAFSRYERGEASPIDAVLNLFYLLERHPEMLLEIRRRDV